MVRQRNVLNAPPGNIKQEKRRRLATIVALENIQIKLTETQIAMDVREVNIRTKRGKRPVNLVQVAKRVVRHPQGPNVSREQ